MAFGTGRSCAWRSTEAMKPRQFSIWSTDSSSESSKPCPPDDGRMKQVKLITDGACIGNPGPGGWACVLRFGERTREMYGSEPETTNNRMELQAAVQGLRA